MDSRCAHPQLQHRRFGDGSPPSITKSMDLEALLLLNDGVILARDHRPLRRRLSRWADRGLLVRVLRGIYVAAGTQHDHRTLVRVVARAYPDAIFTGRTAAWLNGWSDVVPRKITAMHRGRSIRSGRIRLSHGTLSDEVWHERHGLRFLTPAMAALDLVPELGGKLVDDLLRTDRTGGVLTQLHRALASSPGRAGNVVRRILLERSRSNPWSEAERHLHDLLDAAGITGWSANDPVVEDGQRFHPDVVFRAARLILEVDGFAFHSGREVFERDRRRQNTLVINGWQVLRLTWRMLTEDPDGVIALIRRALVSRAPSL